MSQVRKHGTSVAAIQSLTPAIPGTYISYICTINEECEIYL